MVMLAQVLLVVVFIGILVICTIAWVRQAQKERRERRVVARWLAERELLRHSRDDYARQARRTIRR